MTIAAVVTIIGVLIAVLVLAGYLIYVAFALRRVSNTLTAINSGLELVTQKTQPVGPVIGDINQALGGVDARLQSVLTRDRPPELPAPWVVVPRTQTTKGRPDPS